MTIYTKFCAVCVNTKKFTKLLVKIKKYTNYILAFYSYFINIHNDYNNIFYYNMRYILWTITVGESTAAIKIYYNIIL